LKTTVNPGDASLLKSIRVPVLLGDHPECMAKFRNTSNLQFPRRGDRRGALQPHKDFLIGFSVVPTTFVAAASFQEVFAELKTRNAGVGAAQIAEMNAS
jgi:hypothetical protein